MLERLKRFFAKNNADPTGQSSWSTGHDVRVATCALLLEMARIDGRFSKDEVEGILKILMERYDLDREDADALVKTADRELEESLDLWQFSKRINQNYTNEEKIEILELLWQIVYIDGKLDQHENYLMHKLEQLLRLSHKQLMDAKLKVLNDGS